MSSTLFAPGLTLGFSSLCVLSISLSWFVLGGTERITARYVHLLNNTDGMLLHSVTGKHGGCDHNPATSGEPTLSDLGQVAVMADVDYGKAPGDVDVLEHKALPQNSHADDSTTVVHPTVLEPKLNHIFM